MVNIWMWLRFGDPHLRAPGKEVRRKIDIYRKHSVRVQPGGIFMEVARLQGKEHEVMPRLADIGCNVIEVSFTATNSERDLVKEAEFIRTG
jgi:phosphosulfolactate synthase (CoM biosynthesis protein A)